jgi:hypothetical protein
MWQEFRRRACQLKATVADAYAAFNWKRGVGREQRAVGRLSYLRAAAGPQQVG